MAYISRNRAMCFAKSEEPIFKSHTRRNSPFESSKLIQISSLFCNKVNLHAFGFQNRSDIGIEQGYTSLEKDSVAIFTFR